jgi:hypothetical protein
MNSIQKKFYCIPAESMGFFAVAGYCSIHFYYIVTDLFKAFLGNGSVNISIQQQWKIYLSGRMLELAAR